MLFKHGLLSGLVWVILLGLVFVFSLNSINTASSTNQPMEEVIVTVPRPDELGIAENKAPVKPEQIERDNTAISNTPCDDEVSRSNESVI